MHLERLKQAAQVRLDGFLGEFQAAPDGLVGQTFGEQEEDFPLPDRQFGGGLVLR